MSKIRASRFMWDSGELTPVAPDQVVALHTKPVTKPKRPKKSRPKNR